MCARKDHLLRVGSYIIARRYTYCPVVCLGAARAKPAVGADWLPAARRLMPSPPPPLCVTPLRRSGRKNATRYACRSVTRNGTALPGDPPTPRKAKLFDRQPELRV